MTQDRPEIKADTEPMDSRAAQDRFEELADKIRQQGYLPPQGDQSWREREAMRRAAYDRGYTPPPQSDQSWRESEALRFVPLRDESAEAAASKDIELPEPLAKPASAKVGSAGIIFAFFLVVAIGVIIVAFTAPEMLTAQFWRGTAATQSPAPAPPPAMAPAKNAPPAEPAPPPPSMPAPARVPDLPAPALNVAPPGAAKPEPTAPPPARAARPAARDETGGFYAKVPGPDGTLEYKFFPSEGSSGPSQPGQSRSSRSSPTDARSEGGFYARVPGPDGTLQNKYFPPEAPPDQSSASPSKSRTEPATPSRDTSGFYARVPGPDGTMEYKFFPSKPPR